VRPNVTHPLDRQGAGVHLDHDVRPADEHARERVLRTGRDQDQRRSECSGSHGSLVASQQQAGRSGRLGLSCGKIRSRRWGCCVDHTPSPGGYHCSVTVAPSWSRPDDAVRQAQLDAMKRRATGLLALAAAVFAGASMYEGQYPWLGYVRATAEASLVRGLGDLVAVTAVVRHPLGLPIPHTAIVATRKERIGRILGNFVQNHFLSRDVIAANLRAVRPAERAARWLSDPAHSREIARQVAGGLAKTLEALPDDDAQELVRQVVTARVRATRVAPALG